VTVADDPLVSVIIPVKNGERFLPDALADVAGQTYTNRETIVVDGGSTDRSAEIARSSPGTRVVEQDGEGLADAWNVGLEDARGELIAFLDSDDRWAAEKLAMQVELLVERPEIDYAVTEARFFLEPGCPCPPSFRPELLQRPHVIDMPSALMARRSTFDVVGNFSTDYELASDLDWFARAKDSVLVRGVVAEPLVLKRVHDTNLSWFGPGMNRELLDVLRRSVVRQRTR
jgi:glycosyltransferase involved in cell wall biosynthesis